MSGQVGEAQSGQGLPANDLAFHEQIGYQPIGVPLFHRLTAANLFNSGPANNGPPPPKKMPEQERYTGLNHKTHAMF